MCRASEIKTVLIHGLGQNAQSFEKVRSVLEHNQIEVTCPDLFALSKKAIKTYDDMYKDFEDFCNGQSKIMNLCGLSLGGILALDYAKKNPDKVNKIAIIGVPYRVPKLLFKLQGIIFYFMPQKMFVEIGIAKKNFIHLVNSMGKLNISEGLDNIDHECLIIYGRNDKANLKSLDYLHNALKNSQTAIIENSSHEVNIDNPKDLSKTLMHFLKHGEYIEKAEIKTKME